MIVLKNWVYGSQTTRSQLDLSTKNHDLMKKVILGDIVLRKILEETLKNNFNEDFVQYISLSLKSFSLVCKRWYEEVLPGVQVFNKLGVSGEDEISYKRILNFVRIGIVFKRFTLLSHMLNNTPVRLCFLQSPYLCRSVNVLGVPYGQDLFDLNLINNFRKLSLVSAMIDGTYTNGNFLNDIFQYNSFTTLKIDFNNNIDIINFIIDMVTKFESISRLSIICRYHGIGPLGSLLSTNMLIPKIKNLEIEYKTINNIPHQLRSYLNNPLNCLEKLKLKFIANQNSISLYPLLTSLLNSKTIKTISIVYQAVSIDLNKIVGFLINNQSIRKLIIEARSIEPIDQISVNSNNYQNNYDNNYNNSLEFFSIKSNTIDFKSIEKIYNVCKKLWNFRIQTTGARGAKHEFCEWLSKSQTDNKYLYFNFNLSYNLQLFEYLPRNSVNITKYIKTLTIVKSLSDENTKLQQKICNLLDQFQFLQNLTLCSFDDNITLFLNPLSNNKNIEYLSIQFIKDIAGGKVRVEFAIDLLASNRTIQYLNFVDPSMNYIPFQNIKNTLPKFKSNPVIRHFQYNSYILNK